MKQNKTKHAQNASNAKNKNEKRIVSEKYAIYLSSERTHLCISLWYERKRIIAISVHLACILIECVW